MQASGQQVIVCVEESACAVCFGCFASMRRGTPHLLGQNIVWRDQSPPLWHGGSRALVQQCQSALSCVGPQQWGCSADGGDVPMGWLDGAYPSVCLPNHVDGAYPTMCLLPNPGSVLVSSTAEWALLCVSWELD